MHCRSILKWIGLTVISITIVLLLSTIAQDDTVSAANDTVNDAVLTHRSERGGSFTLILQPPQRVAPADEPQSASGSLGTTIAKTQLQTPTFQAGDFICTFYAAGFDLPEPNPVHERYQAILSLHVQYPTSNGLTVDGINSNFGIAPGGESPGTSAAGNMPAFTASGGANSLSSFDSIRELNIKTSVLTPEYGRVAGEQFEVITHYGTNNLHGTLFHAFGNDVLDANDWFANSRGLKEPAKRLNSFGGTLSGPIKRSHTFFFASYEGMRFRQPMVGITDVPSLNARVSAPAELRSLLNAFPLPNGVVRPDGLAEFASSFANPAKHDVGAIRVDHRFTSDTTLRVRYNFADSEAGLRGPAGFSLNTTNRIQSRSQVLSGSLKHTAPRSVLELAANYSRARVNSAYLLDEFGGGTGPSVSPSAFTFDLNSRNAAWMSGSEESNLQRQFNLLGSVVIVNGNHSFKFGGDFRRLSPRIGLRTSEENVLFDGVAQALTGVPLRISQLHFGGRQNLVFNSVSLFAQDEWKQSKRLKLSYGMRWELAPAPSIDDAFAVDQVDDPATISLAPQGSSLWKTTFLNFAPRASVAYELFDKTQHELVLRAGAGIHYDLGQDRSGDVVANSIPFVSGASVPLLAFDPQLRLPYFIKWNVALQKNLGRQSISATYLGSSGKRLFHTETLLNQNPDFDFLRVTTNRGNSDYRALQIKFEPAANNGLSLVTSYTLAQSVDNVSYDSARRVIMTSSDPAFDRGPSDFDVRHELTGSASYKLPAPFSRGLGNKLSRNWALDSIFVARSARPLNVLYLVPTSFGVAYFRPDVVDGNSLSVFDPLVAGGRRLNPAAFVVPEDLQQGNFARNSLRGFPLYQIDLSLRRKFNFSESVALQVQADAFNVFNHANFEDPLGNDLVIGRDATTFGESTAMSGRSLSGGGFPSFYGFGGPRTLRLSVKLMF